jgi:hypothetical protein
MVPPLGVLPGIAVVRRSFLLWRRYTFRIGPTFQRLSGVSGDATMELGVNVACVTHASRVRALMRGDQSYNGVAIGLSSM